MFSIASGYELPEDIPLAFAYVVNENSGGKDGNTAGSDPTFNLSGYGGTTKVFGNRYAKNGFNVRVGIYCIKNAKKGSVIYGENGFLFY